LNPMSPPRHSRLFPRILMAIRRILPVTPRIPMVNRPILIVRAPSSSPTKPNRAFQPPASPGFRLDLPRRRSCLRGRPKSPPKTLTNSSKGQAALLNFRSLEPLRTSFPSRALRGARDCWILHGTPRIHVFEREFHRSEARNGIGLSPVGRPASLALLVTHAFLA
jgi:hypothetical protein